MLSIKSLVIVVASLFIGFNVAYAASKPTIAIIGTGDMGDSLGVRFAAVSDARNLANMHETQGKARKCPET